MHTPEELSGFLNKALEGLSRLRSNNWKFTYSLTEADVTKMYLRLSDPVYAFLEDCCTEDYSSKITKRMLFDAYCEYAKANKIKPMNIKKFGKCLQEQGCMPIEDCWIGLDKGWQGVKLGGESKDKANDVGQINIEAEA